MHAVARPKSRPGRVVQGPPKRRLLSHAGRLAVGVVAAMAGTLGQYLRPPSRDAGPTTIHF